MKPILLIPILLILSSPAMSAEPNPQAEVFFDRAGIVEWLNGSVARGDGDFSNGIARGNWIKYCAGAGCPIKIPFTFTKAHIVKAAEAMQSGRAQKNCLANTPACERIGLQYGVRALDNIVKREKLDSISHAQVVKNSVMRDSNGDDPSKFFNDINPRQQLTRDCVDQAANGMSFLIVLANNGLLAHHRVITPGLMFVPNPHYFTRIKEFGGRTFRFDLYRSPRNDFEKLPGVIAIEQ